MAAKIYTAPKEVSLPSNTFDNVKDWQENDEKYIANLKKHLQEELGYNEKNTGEVIKFPAADGYALYMVISMKPLMLVHLELGDAWCYQYASRLTAKDVQTKIDQQKRIDEMFAKRK